jgi:hypothetical protein
VSESAPEPNVTLSVLEVRGAPFRLSRRLGAAGGATGVETEAEAEGTAVEVEAAGAEVEGVGVGLRGAGDPGAGDGEGRAEPVPPHQYLRVWMKMLKLTRRAHDILDSLARRVRSYVDFPLAHDILRKVRDGLVLILAQLVHCHSDFRFL